MMKQATPPPMHVYGQMPGKQTHTDELEAVHKLIERKFGLLRRRETNIFKKLLLSYKKYVELKKARSLVSSADNMYSIY